MKKRKSVNKKNPQITLDFTKEALIVAGLLLLAFILRLVYLSHLKVNDPYFYQSQEGTDMLTYHNFALQILNGTLDKSPYYYGPLYFYFLAFIYKIFGPDPYIARLCQMILGVGTSLLIYLIARKVFNKPVALISISISILYGMFYIHEGVLLMESLTTFLNTLSIFLLLKIEKDPSYKNIALAGIAIGLSALSRANILLFVPFILVWMLIMIRPQMNTDKDRKKDEPRMGTNETRKSLKLMAYSLQLKRFGFLCLVILLTISPATIRNYLVSGRFVFISTNGPILFWFSNNPYATGEYIPPPPVYANKIAEMVKEMGDKVYIEEVMRFFRERPVLFLKLQIRKFLLFWDRYEIENNVNYGSQRGYSSLFKIPIFLGFGIVGPLGIFGIFLSLRTKKAFLLHFFILAFMSAMILFHILARHRLSCLPVLIIFSAFSIWWWYEKAKDKKYKPLFLSLILLILSCLLGYSQEITGRVYPLIHSEGFHIWQPEGILIRDTTNTRHGEEKCEIRSSEDYIKKELIIKENPADYKKAIFWLIASIGKNPGVLSIQINDKEVLASFAYSRDLLDRYPIELKAEWLKEGVNTIILKPVEMAEVNLAIDNFYTFGRSYLLKDGKWERLKRGEYMIWLNLIKDDGPIQR